MTRRAWQHVGVAAIVALVAIGCIWCIWVVRAFELTKPYGHNLLKAAGLAFTAPNLINITYGSISFGFALAGGLAALVYQFGNPRQQRYNFVRGSEFIESGELARYTRKGMGIGFGKGLGTQVALAGVPIPRQIERLHFLIGGTTQSGKTVTITEMLAGALRRGDRAVVADPNGGYYARFGQPDDVILNPFDRRSVGWSIFNEISKNYDVARRSGVQP